MKFPKHINLTLEHNPHVVYYQTVRDYMEDIEGGDTDELWAAEGQREKAIAANELWVIQWYPDTPVGFFRLLAADMDVLLQAALA